MTEDHPFQLFPSTRKPLSRLVARVADVPLGSLLGLRRCARLYATLERKLDAGVFAEQALACLGLSLETAEADCLNVPREGTVVIVANHPYGGLEGLALIALLSRLRKDVKVLANPVLTRFPELRDVIIPLDPFKTRQTRLQNIAALRAGHRWLEQGGLLVVFPAGEVSHLHIHCREIIDPQWQPGVGHLVRRSGATVVPVYFPGSNGLMFQAAGLLHPRLRTMLLPRQLLNKQGKKLSLSIGEPITANRLKPFASNRELVDYLRLKTYLLGEKNQGISTLSLAPTSAKVTADQEPLSDPVDRSLLAQAVDKLPADALLHTHGDYQVWCIRADQAPLLLTEIGRLRELTFRGHGEGTGRALDLDNFDGHYLHLFVWHVMKQEVVGAYRVGACDEILHERGLQGLYTNTLFRYRRRLFAEVGPSLELGRSFVRPEYQKSFAPLLLLWQGIGSFLVRNPRYRVLFGPVSISRDYSDFARQLMTQSLAEQASLPELARYVAPRIPVATRLPRLKGCPSNLAATFTRNIDAVNALLADLEAGQKGLPVLIRHYLNLGGKILAFNLDPDFSEVIDGLIMVDLDQTDARTLARYMGKDGVACFRAHGGVSRARPAA